MSLKCKLGDYQSEGCIKGLASRLKNEKDVDDFMLALPAGFSRVQKKVLSRVECRELKREYAGLMLDCTCIPEVKSALEKYI